MIRDLMNQIAQDEMSAAMESSLADVTSNKIRSAFLDTVGFDVVGAEDDPEIKALIDQIPEYEDGVDENELRAQTESFLAELPNTDI